MSSFIEAFSHCEESHAFNIIYVQWKYYHKCCFSLLNDAMKVYIGIIYNIITFVKLWINVNLDILSQKADDCV